MVAVDVFDARDGWAVVRGLEVRSAQRWLLDNQGSVLQDYGSGGNKLMYLLNRRHDYVDAIADTVSSAFKTTLGENPFKWPQIPEELLELDAQLREVLVERDTGLKLLGGVDDGEFILGFAQPTLLPAGEQLTPHYDKEGYGCVIVTVGLFGKADIKLSKMPNQQLGGTKLLPVERTAEIGPAMAYGMWGKARWKMHHNALVGPCEQPIKGLFTTVPRKPVARAAVTLRYFRRSYAETKQAEMVRAKSQQPQRLPAWVARTEPGEFLDVRSFDADGLPADIGNYPCKPRRRLELQPPGAQPATVTHACGPGVGADTYPAFVLSVDPRRGVAWVCTLSDGLTREDDLEAMRLAQVPCHAAAQTSVAAKRRCRELPSSQRAIATLELLVQLLRLAGGEADGGAGSSSGAGSSAGRAGCVRLELPWRTLEVPSSSPLAALADGRRRPVGMYDALYRELENLSHELASCPEAELQRETDRRLSEILAGRGGGEPR